MKTAILFDLDGTLLDTLTDLYHSVNYTLAQFGLPERTREQVRWAVGGGALQLLALSLPGLSGEPEAENLLPVYQAHYAQHCQDNTAPYPGVLELLNTLAQRYPLGIVSNKPDAATKTLCAQFFPGIYALGQRTDIPKKPAPDMLIKAMADLGVERCIYVGDSETDVEVAQNAGVPGICVLWGFRDRELLEEAGATHFCTSTQQLLDLICQLTEEGN